MAQKPEDFNLPQSAISKIIKDAVPEGVRVTDLARLTLAKAASVFVLFTTSSANSLSQDANRKRLLAKDVLDAVKDLDMDFLIPSLQNSLIAYRKSLETKKQNKSFKKGDSQEEDEEMEDSIDMEPSQTEEEVITLDSDSEPEKEDITTIDSDSSSSE